MRIKAKASYPHVWVLLILFLLNLLVFMLSYCLTIKSVYISLYGITFRYSIRHMKGNLFAVNLVSIAPYIKIQNECKIFHIST